MTETDHQTCVDGWLEEQARDLALPQLLALLDRALTAVWQRAQRTLGDVTLRAIMDRVLHTAADTHPVLSGLKLEAGGVRGGDLAGRVQSREELTEAMRFLLVEFLTVLGNLTADILTPALHSELTAVTVVPAASKTRRVASTPRKVGEHKA
jgi:hypothetical protein